MKRLRESSVASHRLPSKVDAKTEAETTTSNQLMKSNGLAALLSSLLFSQTAT